MSAIALTFYYEKPTKRLRATNVGDRRVTRKHGGRGRELGVGGRTEQRRDHFYLPRRHQFPFFRRRDQHHLGATNKHHGARKPLPTNCHGVAIHRAMAKTCVASDATSSEDIVVRIFLPV